MFCPACAHEDTKVIDTRIAADGTSVRRRRECGACGHRFSTIEGIELLDLVVIKRDGSREAYTSEKVEHGLRRALEKRPHTDAQVRGLMSAIERDIQRENASEMASGRIGEIVMERLKTFDKVAYIRFASVYRSFEDVKEFKKELEDL
ncbi:transcriptional regulator NrdR [Patescibacteria group bacterium]|nr:transcriptional regulator NrdR [Patescibacteria group bacterium]MBU1448319.1 transcriptional regulator NrdR [Patescibacteria group bacterium]MBU2612977.1 transcriptional regulator NrdR [Patescibacteria group bacterium]